MIPLHPQVGPPHSEAKEADPRVARAKEAVSQAMEAATINTLVEKRVSKAKVCQPETSAEVILGIPAHLHLRSKIDRWIEMKASAFLLQTINKGVLWDFPCP